MQEFLGPSQNVLFPQIILVEALEQEAELQDILAQARCLAVLSMDSADQRMLIA